MEKEVEKKIMELKKRGMGDLGISRELGIPQEIVYKTCARLEKSKKISCVGIIFILVVLSSMSFATAALNVQLSDQGTGVSYYNGTLVNSGDLTVLIYDSSVGGNLIYSETFSGAILNGSWNVMLGSGDVDLPLEFGGVYYKDYIILGEDAQFDGNDRQAFYSPLGDIDQDDINPASNITVNSGFFSWIGSLVSRITNIWANRLNVDEAIEFVDANHTLTANDTSIYYYDGSSYHDLTSGDGSISGGNITDVNCINFNSGGRICSL